MDGGLGRWKNGWVIGGDRYCNKEVDGHTDGRLDGMKVWTDGGYMGWGVDGCLSGCAFGGSLNQQMAICIEVWVGIHVGRQEKIGKVYRR